MSRVMPITGVFAAAMLAAAPAALAQVPNRDTARSPWDLPPSPGSNNGTGAASADTTFIRQAIRGNFTEVALGRLAEDRAEESAVEDFAERMVSDHNSMNEDWADLARDNDMRVGLEFGPAGQQAIERLKDLEGAEFDQAYMSEMIRHHEQDLATFQRMATSARSSEVRQLASSGASTIREHLALAREVGSGVGIASTAGRAGGVTTPVPAPRDDSARRTTVARTDREEGDARNDRDRRTPLRAADRTFVEGVLSDHLMHVRLAKRAKREARSDATRELAERMEKDFEKWAERWESFADRRDAKVTSHLERQHREKLQRLDKAAERKDFDRAYAAIVAEHLEALVDDFREERQEARAQAVRRLAADELPMLRENLARARRLEAKESRRMEDSDRK
jgi:putative membrane protein